MRDLEYSTAFASFLASTNEKSALYTWLEQAIEQHRISSLLDIGPGNGDLSVPLSRLVQRYVAVEPNELYVAALRASGLEVVHSAFPAPLTQTFSMVLASHVIDVDDAQLPLFIESAWRAVNHDGVCVVITHRGADDDWQALCERLAYDNLPYHRAVFERSVELLQQHGEVAQQRLHTTIESSSREQMLSALGFVWSDGNHDRWVLFERHQQAVADLLDTHYRRQDRYVFPFEQTVITTTASG